MFFASKVLAFAIEPLCWVFLFLLAGLLLLPRRQRLGKRLLWISFASLMLSGWIAIPSALMRDLESRYPQLPADADMQRYVGVVVLGGALRDPKLWAEHNQVALNEYAERMTTAVTLTQRYPHLKVLFSGGLVAVARGGMTESQRAKIFFDQMGVPAARVVYESSSRNTYENAYFSAQVPGVDKQQSWLLLTSSFHMPRSMGVFRKIGWNVTPYPVDYQTSSGGSWYDFSFHFGPGQWELALHELIGYYVYKATGKI